MKRCLCLGSPAGRQRQLPQTMVPPAVDQRMRMSQIRLQTHIQVVSSQYFLCNGRTPYCIHAPCMQTRHMFILLLQMPHRLNEWTLGTSGSDLGVIRALHSMLLHPWKGRLSHRGCMLQSSPCFPRWIDPRRWWMRLAMTCQAHSSPSASLAVPASHAVGELCFGLLSCTHCRIAASDDEMQYAVCSVQCAVCRWLSSMHHAA